MTETDEIAQAIADAREHWPEHRDNPAELLRDLVRYGHQALVNNDANAAAAHKAKLLELAGSLTEAFPAGYLDELRAEWPE